MMPVHSVIRGHLSYTSISTTLTDVILTTPRVALCRTPATVARSGDTDMPPAGYGVGDFVDEDLSHVWSETRNQISMLLISVGLTETDGTRALHILRHHYHLQSNVENIIDNIRINIDANQKHCFLEGTVQDSVRGPEKEVAVFPVKNGVSLKTKSDIARALYVETHSVLVAWWAVTAWRSLQLASAT